MSKFHINKHGVPAPCKAEKGKCPYGGESGDENHFDTLEEAQAYADKMNAATHGYLPGMNQSPQAVFEEIYEENGGVFIGITSQPEDFGDNEQVRQEFVNNFGDDATIIEANDSNKDPLNYSLDSNYDGLVGPYENLKSTMTEEQRSRFLDENEEFTPEIRQVLSDYLKSKEGPEKRVFGKKFKSIENAYDGAEFLRNYINNN